MMASLRGDELREADMIRRARAADQDAWTHIIDLHREAVFRLAYLHLGDADAAEDVAQETFIRAHRHLDRFDLTRPLRPWLLRIATNQAHNWRRSAGRHWAALQRLAQKAVAPAPETEEVADHKWQSALLREAVQMLPPRDRDLIYLRYFLDLPVNDTAATLGIAPGTVKSRSHRALHRLRGILEKSFPTFEGVQLLADE